MQGLVGNLLSYVRHLEYLEILHIHCWGIVNDQFLKVIAENCKHLSKLSLEGKTNPYFYFSEKNSTFYLKYYHIICVFQIVNK